METPNIKKSDLFAPIFGCKKDELDSRDKKYTDVMGAVPVGMPDFTEGYDVEERFGALPDNSQGSAYDCVAEGGTEDVNMAIRVFTNKWTFLSPRDAYSQIYIPPNGASSPRDFYKLAKNIGICEDRFLPTRPNGQPLTESFARKRDDLLPNPIYWKIGSYYSINSNNIQSLTQAIFSNHGCGGAYFPTGGAMGHFIFFGGYGTYRNYWALKYRDTYAPFTKWIYLKDNNYYLQDGTAIDLAGIWTCEPGEWKAYEKREITCEMIRLAWLLRDDLKRIYPFSTKFYNIDNSGDTIYDWAQKHLYDEMPELFNGKLDWSKVDMNMWPEYKFITLEEVKNKFSFKELWKHLWNWLSR